MQEFILFVLFAHVKGPHSVLRKRKKENIFHVSYVFHFPASVSSGVLKGGHNVVHIMCASPHLKRQKKQKTLAGVCVCVGVWVERVCGWRWGVFYLLGKEG